MPPKKANKKKIEKDSDSEDDVSVKKSINAFSGLMSDSDDSEESDNDSPVVNKKSSNPYGDLSSNEDSDEDDIESSEEKPIENLKIIPTNKKNNIIENNKKNNIIENIKKEKNNIVENVKKEKQNNKKKEKNNGKDDSIKINKKEGKKDNRINLNNGKTTYFTENVELIIAGKVLINESNLVINSETKYSVVGRNGVGKSCLMKYVYEKMKNDFDILMINQDTDITKNEKIIDFILKANIELFNNNNEFERLSEIEELSDDEHIKYNELCEYLSVNEWDKYNSEAKRILSGLGFNDINSNSGVLSGGWLKRLVIGRALLIQPKILVLDEINNFLDVPSITWLTNYLVSYKHTLIIITHQIDLINAISDITLYVDDMDMTGVKIHTIRGNYNNVIKKIEDTNKILEKNYEKYQKKIKELKNKSTTKKDMDEYVKNNFVPRPPREYFVKMDFGYVSAPGSDKIIEFKDVDFSYNEDKTIFTNLNITLNMDSIMVLTGANGSGKTTFFKLCDEEIKPINGVIIRDERLRVGYFHQALADSLDCTINSIEYLKSMNSDLSVENCRALLGRLGIKKNENNYDLPTTIIKNLSGGQKSRLALASIMAKKPHLLLLDEISAHLDIQSIDGLINGLNEFNGGIILISHDLYLIENLKNAIIYEKKENNFIKFNNNFSDYCEQFKD